MPLLKYTLFAGSSLLALIMVADHFIAPSPATISSASSSLEILRKMANHGEARGFAPLASAGEFLPVPAIETLPVQVAAEPVTGIKPNTVASTSSPAALDAQARVAESEIIERPARHVKKAANRKPRQPRTAYVENVQRGPFGFFGVNQSW